jgi:cell wall-associated NlpC family hydrolase
MKLAFGFGLIGMVSLVHGQDGKIVGNYGQALEPTKIYKAPNSRSKAYCTVKQFQYLVVRPHSDRYTAVLMNKGVVGYVRADKVAILPEKVKMTTGRESGGSTVSRAAAARKGINFIGTPYVWGGNDINRGIDCSGFVKELYGDIGINLPRTAAEQARVGKPITRLEDLQPGDRLYFWEKKRGKIGHTGLYLGNGYFVHSSRGKNGVDTDFLSEKWRRILVSARR